MKQIDIHRNESGTYCLAADGVIINPSVRLADLIPEIKKATGEQTEVKELSAEDALHINRDIWNRRLAGE